MIILGIDPGIAIAGYGIIEYKSNHFNLIDYGTIKTTNAFALPDRLVKIYNGIEILIQKYIPEAIAVEELFFNTNVKTALIVGQARGVTLLAAAKSCAHLYEYTPLQVKQAVVGYGRADKSQVQYMVKTILNLQSAPKPDDAADALAVAICHAHSSHMEHLYKIR